MKPRRDITLGEMQDECRMRMHICAPDVDGNNECKYFEVCNQMTSVVFAKPCPEVWDLTDPPRFNEAQMALLKAFRKSGYLTFEVGTIFYPLEEIINNFLGLRNGEKIDLAELFGKDAI